MSYRIQPASINHVEPICLLTNELGYNANAENTRQWLTQLIESKNHGVFIAQKDNNETCGWIVIEKRVFLESGYKAEITGLVIGSDYRRLGLGKQLVAAAEAWAHEHGLLKLTVRSNIQRKESHPFYESLGYTLKKTSHTYEKILG